MTAWIIFVAGFAAGAAIGLRDLPLAAILLGSALLLFGLQLGAFTP
ncbi:hypothetical protein [Tabrizicola flagellatus]|nr:hypothetical protein [Tabrizicola flagellatus]